MSTEPRLEWHRDGGNLWAVPKVGTSIRVEKLGTGRYASWVCNMESWDADGNYFGHICNRIGMTRREMKWWAETDGWSMLRREGLV